LELPAQDQKMLAEHLGKGVVGQALTSEPINDPEIVFSFAPKPVTYLFTSGKKRKPTQAKPRG